MEHALATDGEAYGDVRTRPDVRRAQPAPAAGLCRHCRPDDCTRHRRHHRDLQRGQRRVVAAAALRRCGEARHGLVRPAQPERRRLPAAARRFPRHADHADAVRWARGINTFRPTIGGDGRGDSEQVVGAGVTTNIFNVLGHRIQFGRGFVEEDGTPQPPPPPARRPPHRRAPPPPLPTIAMLSYEFWQRRYGGDDVDRRQEHRIRQRPRRDRRRAGARLRAAVSARHQRRSAPRHPGRQPRQLTRPARATTCSCASSRS